MCLCQASGKSGVPNARGYCLVCGAYVDPTPADPTPAEDAPDPFAVALDRCQVCDQVIGFGIVAFHLRLCDECRAAQAADPEERH